MMLATRRARLLNAAAVTAVLLLAGHPKVFAQLSGFDNDGDGLGNPFAPPVIHATLPLTLGWFNGEPCFYLSTEASDPGVAASFNANYAPVLANAASPVPIYVVANFSQGNIVPSAPIPAGPGSTSANYSPLWQVHMVTWNSGATPQLLTSVQQVMAMQTAGQITVAPTDIIVNCSIIWTQAGGVVPGSTVSMAAGAKAGSTQATATLPVVIGWFNGQAALYISPEASTAAAAGSDGNISTLLAASANTSAAPPIYVVTNFKQGNIIPVAPLSTGPTNVSTTYSPLWQVVTVTWNSGVAPTLLTSSQDVQAAMTSGKVTLKKTNIIVNCPVIYTPLGGALPGVTISTQSNQG